MNNILEVIEELIENLDSIGSYLKINKNIENLEELIERLQKGYNVITKFCSSQNFKPIKYELKNIILNNGEPFIGTFYPSFKLFALLRARGYKDTSLDVNFKIIGSKKKNVIVGVLFSTPFYDKPKIVALDKLPQITSLIKVNFEYEPIKPKIVTTIDKILSPDSIAMVRFNINSVSIEDINKEGYIKLYDNIRLKIEPDRDMQSIEFNIFNISNITELLNDINDSNIENILELLNASKYKLIALFKRLKISNII